MSIARRVTLACRFVLLAVLAAAGAARADEPRAAAEPAAESTTATNDRDDTTAAPTTTATNVVEQDAAAEPLPPVPATPPVMPATVVTPSGVQGERAKAATGSPLAAAAAARKGQASAAAATPTTTPAAKAARPEPNRSPEQPRTVSRGRYGAIELGRPPQAASRWRGFPISLSLRDAPLPEVLRSFARIAGVNLVLHPGVTGTVTVELHDVPWDQALHVILKTQGMAAEIDGRVWIVEPN